MKCKALSSLLLLGALLGCASGFTIVIPDPVIYPNSTATIAAPGLGPQNITTTYRRQGSAESLSMPPGTGVATVINFPAGIKTLVSGINGSYAVKLNMTYTLSGGINFTESNCVLFTDSAGYQMLSAMSSVPANCSNLPSLGYQYLSPIISLSDGYNGTVSGGIPGSNGTLSVGRSETLIFGGIKVVAPADGKLYVVVFTISPKAPNYVLASLQTAFTLTNESLDLPPPAPPSPVPSPPPLPSTSAPPPAGNGSSPLPSSGPSPPSSPSPPPPPPTAGTTSQPQRYMALLSAAAGMLLCFMSLV